MKRSTVVTLTAVGVASAIGLGMYFVVFRPRPTQLMVSARAGDDTMIINQARRTKLTASVRDQYGRVLASDTAVQYRRIGGDSVGVASNGDVLCDKRGDLLVRATFAALAKDFVLRCRPVKWIEAPSWLDLVAGDSVRDLAFTAHDPDGRTVTELRGDVRVEDASVVALQGTTVRPKRAGFTYVGIQIGDAKAGIPIMVYRPVTSFVGNPPREELLAMRVHLARGDTMMLPIPKAAFWVTYLPNAHGAVPPTIELRGDGSCTTGDGIRLRRIEEDQYAKYCLSGDGTRMMIAHGATGADTVSGTVALRVMR